MTVSSIICGNLTASILDNLSQFPKSNSYEEDWSRFDQEKFCI